MAGLWETLKFGWEQPEPVMTPDPSGTMIAAPNIGLQRTARLRLAAAEAGSFGARAGATA